MAIGLEAMGVFGVKNAGSLIFTSLITNKPSLYIGFANSITLDCSADSVAAKAQGVDAITWEGAKTTSLKIATEMTSFDLLGFVMGSTLREQSTNFYKRETVVLKTEAEQITLKEATIVADSVCVFELGADGNTQGAELTTATVSGNKVTMTGGKVGSRYVIYYMTSKTAKTFMVKAKKEVQGFYQLNMIVEGKSWANGQAMPMEIEFKKVEAQTSLSLEFSSESPSSFEMTLNVLQDGNGDLFEIKNLLA